MNKCLPVLLLALALGCGDDAPRNDTGGWNSYPDYGNNTYLDTGGGGTCGPSSCGGCCQGTTCMSVTTASACGYGGLDCKQCQSTETCKAGVCTPAAKCDSTTCSSGCCDSLGKCKSGTSDNVCGSGGASCSQCKTTEACTSGACKSKAPAKYTVTLVSAKVTGCGLGDTCDAFVTLKVGSTTKKSTTKDDTESPVWNELMATETETVLMKSFGVEVLDEDLYFDDSLGKCTPSITKSVLAAGKLVTTCGTVKSLTFEFKQKK